MAAPLFLCIYARVAAAAQSRLSGKQRDAIWRPMELREDIEWKVSTAPVPYAEALQAMETRAAAVREGIAPELIWLLEHPSLFTAGTSADPAELSNPEHFPVFDAGRGGRYTYHGPGQRVGYVILDLDKRGRDIRRFVHSLEGWMIEALDNLGVSAHRAPGRIGIWVGDGSAEAKIGALGVRVKRWVSLHGFSLNVTPNLAHFTGIVPCGIADFGVASLESLGKQISMSDVDAALEHSFRRFLSGLEKPCEST